MARCSAAVPLAQATAWRAPTASAKAVLERLDPWAGGQEIVAQRRGHRRDVIVVDGLAAVGQERLHAAAFSSTMAIRASAESQSVLVSLA